MSYPEDPEVCIQWRKAHKMTRDLVHKVVWQPVGGAWQNYRTTTYAQFNWKTRTQYHFARFIWWEGPEFIRQERCVYLFRWPFIWGKFTSFWPDPINIYTRFRGIPLLPDGTPDVTFPHNEWGWKIPPDTQLYTKEEWKVITEWENRIFYYNHAYKSCVARYEWVGDLVREPATGRAGIVTDILTPRRDYEWWDPDTDHRRWGVKKKLWMKYLPLIFKVQMEDKTYFQTTRRKLSRF